MAFKFCPECGFKFDKDYKFCPECGYKLDGAVKKEKKPEPLFDFSEDTAKYDDERFGGFDEQLKKQEELKKKEEELNEREAQLKKEEAEKEKAAQKKTAPAPKKTVPAPKGYGKFASDKEELEWAIRADISDADVYERAFSILKKYAENGNAKAQFNLGLYYFTGDEEFDHGVEQDDEQAYRWLKKAADQGYAEAEEYLDYLKDN